MSCPSSSTLRRAIRACRVGLYFQPVVSLVDGSLHGFEGVLRWLDPELGVRPAAALLEVANRHGLLPSLHQVIMEQACIVVADRSYAASGPTTPYVAVELPAGDGLDSSTVNMIVRTVRRADVDPSLLVIDVPERRRRADRPGSSLRSQSCEWPGCARVCPVVRSICGRACGARR